MGGKLSKYRRHYVDSHFGRSLLKANVPRLPSSQDVPINTSLRSPLIGSTGLLFADVLGAIEESVAKPQSPVLSQKESLSASEAFSLLSPDVLAGVGEVLAHSGSRDVGLPKVREFEEDEWAGSEHVSTLLQETDLVSHDAPVLEAAPIQSGEIGLVERVKEDIIKDEAVEFVVSTNGERFHVAGCMVAKRIPQEKRLIKSDALELLRNGLVPCGVCAPLSLLKEGET